MTASEIQSAIRGMTRPDGFIPFVPALTAGERLHVDLPQQVRVDADHVRYASRDRPRPVLPGYDQVTDVVPVERLPSPTGLTLSAFQQTVRRLREQRPFRPFAVELTDGRRFDVTEPEAVGFAGRFGVVTDGDDLFVQLLYDQVARFVVPEEAVSA